MTSGDLERFVSAQESVLPQVDAELKAGRKVTHWMWFVFPQLAGLGRSSTAQFYGIDDLRHAQRYLAHPVLGRRLPSMSVSCCSTPARRRMTSSARPTISSCIHA